LNELNSWLEKFVHNSTSELTALGTHLATLVGPDASPDGTPAPPGLLELVADVHAMVSEQKSRTESEGQVGQRLDGLLRLMGEEKERAAGQQSSE
jgi:hypothetical protein